MEGVCVTLVESSGEDLRRPTVIPARVAAGASTDECGNGFGSGSGPTFVSAFHSISNPLARRLHMTACNGPSPQPVAWIIHVLTIRFKILNMCPQNPLRRFGGQ